ncbi:hypothetical protein Zmor_007992 [Zophobas morio]|uniref:Uncharacterized protein n=1 Tax=Zophobas morio TaxID=2755281 RepID=A0AA38IV89_9CUCU|nr:hypothetical protein Zmor_007992 [Zophobas morio]
MTHISYSYPTNPHSTETIKHPENRNYPFALLLHKNKQTIPEVRNRQISTTTNSTHLIYIPFKHSVKYTSNPPNFHRIYRQEYETILSRLVRFRAKVKQFRIGKLIFAGVFCGSECFFDLSHLL